ncbi:ferredoxin [Thiorhodococcus mannitoliphagus]|uniref:Ferredoxin n=1 Tax=Thiorhodococcus mannitoliphagus TaxID=329406 RepID=A0A6P1DVU7_9GAMM|nr:ferredoxin [Thiorhodococcus mannitoliphagus]NEX20816.1 ferredoxin [Thiorhodococcus mannitoliphagus]
MNPTENSHSQFPDSARERIPALPVAVKDAKATRELMFTLRHCHLGDPRAHEALEPLGDDWLPALLDPFRDANRLRYDYPLILFPPAEGDGSQASTELSQSLAQWLKNAVQDFAPEAPSARILKDHIHWLEHHLRTTLREHEGPVPAVSVLAAAGLALQQHLGLDQGHREALAQDLERLQASVGDAEVMGYGRYPALHLLIHAIRSRVVPRRVRFQARIDACVRGLKSLFQVEWGKSIESIEPKRARDSVGPGGARFDPDALSEVMDHSRGTRKMSDERRARIEQVLEVLESWRPDPVLVRFVHLGAIDEAWMRASDDVRDLVDPDPCGCATTLFDKEAAQLAQVFAAVRIAELEIGSIYDPNIHDPWFASFGWEAFSHEELLLVPCIIALEDASRVAREGLQSLSRLLSSGRPAQILVRIQPSNDPGALPEENPFQSYRTELGYLGIAHRQAVVNQSSAARHQNLLQGYLEALDATQTSLHLINTGMRPPSSLLQLNAWLVAGAGIEGRAHPFFRVNPAAGDFAANRVSFDGNPQEDRDWPVHPFSFRDENGTESTLDLAFTFADYAMLVPRLRDHFRLIPPGCDSDALVPLADYLSLPLDEASQRLPYLWAVDGNAILHRVLVSRELILACRDRLNFWHSLQELAGVKNRYVELAIERTQAEERQQAAEERARLQAEHAAEIERVSESAAGEAMLRLTDTLMGLDFNTAVGTMLPGGRRAEPIAALQGVDATAASQPEESQPAPPAEDAEPDLGFDEPWIDTPLCTSCNDCLRINPQLFFYNEDKQALLGDLNKGSYAQLVEAAEICPAKCIHPGKPWNPEEPGLDALLERAAAFA